MLFPKVLSQVRSGIVAGAFLFTLLGCLFSCNRDSVQDVTEDPPPPGGPDTIVPPPQPNRLDSILGIHEGGICCYYRKQLDTGVETFDTTFNVELKIIRTSPNYIEVYCCGSYPGSWYLPEGSTDSLYEFSNHVASNQYSFKINLNERTIEASRFFLASAPYTERYTGKWKY
jgi:hypothetical protein